MIFGSLGFGIGLSFLKKNLKVVSCWTTVSMYTIYLRCIFKLSHDYKRNIQAIVVVVVVWKGIHSRSDTNRTGAQNLSFYYPRLLYSPDQMLAVMMLSQHRVLSSKTVRPRTPFGARCIGHAISTWSAVWSEAPHMQFGEGAITHLCMDEWNHPTPVLKRLSLTQAVWGKPISTGLALVLGTKARSLEVFSITFIIFPFRSADSKSGKVVQKIPRSWHK